MIGIKGGIRRMTKDEIKNKLLNHMRTMVLYWDRQQLESREKLNGLVHSILVMFDGESDFQPIDIVMEGITLREEYLHDLWDQYK